VHATSSTSTGGHSRAAIDDPNRCTLDQYVSVMREAPAAIGDIDQRRLVIIDRLFGEAMLPMDSMAPAG
jgi:hypothetical protein